MYVHYCKFALCLVKVSRRLYIVSVAFPKLCYLYYFFIILYHYHYLFLNFFYFVLFLLYFFKIMPCVVFFRKCLSSNFETPC